MSDTIIIGIDPGVTGAVAVGFASSQSPHIFDLVPEPASARGEKPGTGKAYNLISAADLHSALATFFGLTKLTMTWPIDRGPRVLAFIESPLAGAANGVRVVGQVSRIIGRCEAVCAVLGAEVTIVAPPKWRRFHGIGGAGGDLGDAAIYKGNKEASLDRACELWPSLVDAFRPPPPLTKGGEPSKVKPAAKDGRAEAALIWAYGRAVATRAGSSG